MKSRVACSIAVVVLAFGALSLAGCSSNKAASAGSVNCTNTSCPFSGKPVNTSCTSTYKGQTIGFCCANCKAKFDAMSDSDKAMKVASAK